MRETYFDDRSWLDRNIWRIIFVVLLLVTILIWNIYVVNNNDGYIRGVVLNSEGQPVEGARVESQEKTINLLKQPIVTVTDKDGRFEYHDIFMIEFVIGARKEGMVRSDSQRHHLYFKGQNYSIEKPIVLTTKPEKKEE